MLKSRAVCLSGVVEACASRGSLNPRPGILGTTIWKGAVVAGSAGWVRVEKSGSRLKFVRGKLGIRRSGVACACGLFKCLSSI